MKHILVIQDLSCLGECSQKAALPVLSVMGHETSLLPVSILSSHTAFQHVYVQTLDGQLEKIIEVWKEENIRFDCILSGYLSNEYQLEITAKAVGELLKEDGIYICDPAMGDHGKLYRGFDSSFPSLMKKLAEKADIILPNITEACLLTDSSYEDRDEMGQRELAELLGRQLNKTVVMTGASFDDGRTGVLVADKADCDSYRHDKSEGSYFGTGDLFAAVFTGSYLNGHDLMDSVRKACDFVKCAIEVTDKDHWYGVQFEKILKQL